LELENKNNKEITSNYKNIELLIFDLDGTLFDSEEFNFKVINHTLKSMGIDEIVSKKTISSHLGEPSEIYYSNILPASVKKKYPSIREKNRSYYDKFIMKYGKSFDGVNETLKELKRGGYKLALYSNSSQLYFSTAIKKLKIENYFDYMECTKQNNLSKIELVKKISFKLKTEKCAVVGDRIHDMEAAEKNRFMSIGALYGYGYNELDKADIRIENFKELLEKI
jgi:phosphoglycolate phosphatase